MRIDIDGKEVPFPEEHKIGKTGAVGNTGRGLFTRKRERMIQKQVPRKTKVLEVIRLPYGVYTITRRTERTGTWFIVETGTGADLLQIAPVLSQYEAHHVIKAHHFGVAHKSRLIREAQAIAANAGSDAPGLPVSA